MARVSLKKLQIDKTNKSIILFMAIASFVVVFSLVSIKALFSQSQYLGRVISDKSKAVNQLKTNLTAISSIEDSFKTFDANPSVLGNSDKNAKIVLDALPSKYDFPALATSIENLLFGTKIENITGSDDEANQENNTGQSSPVALEMPFSAAVTANYDQAQKLINKMQNSIRPFYFDTLELAGNEQELRLSFDAKTYYQPAKNLNTVTKVVK